MSIELLALYIVTDALLKPRECFRKPVEAVSEPCETPDKPSELYPPAGVSKPSRVLQKGTGMDRQAKSGDWSGLRF